MPAKPTNPTTIHFLNESTCRSGPCPRNPQSAPKPQQHPNPIIATITPQHWAHPTKYMTPNRSTRMDSVIKFTRHLPTLLIASSILLSPPTFASPMIAPGDMILRHDIQRLADAGIIHGPTTTWPLAWGPILHDIRNVDSTKLSPAVLDALDRVKQRASWETRSSELTFKAKLGIAEEPTRIRSFQDTPRGNVEASVGGGWIGDWFSADLNVQYVDSDQDDEDIRYDDSMVGVMLGNYSIAASTMQRWWGPGWDGSLIMSNNARPMPSITFDRVFTDPFKTKWLSWLGPWDLNVMFGQMEEERYVPNTKFFGFRFNFRPIPSLEIGLSRAAQWCGDGRPCDLETFVDLLLGNDNRGSDGLDENTEPGNQLAGVDFRWSPSFIKIPMAVYGQFTGEDEAGGFPSRYLAQGGVELSGYILNKWSFRWYAEFADTKCDFLKEDGFNCAYNHDIYKTGYRYRGRTVGHGADNDALLISTGWMMVDANDSQWRVLLRFGDLNRGGSPDSRNTLTPTPQELLSIDLSHSRAFSFGVIDAGIGYEKIDDAVSGSSNSDGRAYLQWRSSY
jgi:hypothetical protein